MKLSNRDAAAALGVFVLVVLCAVGIYVWSTTRVPKSSSMAGANGTGREVFDVASAVNDILSEQQVAEIAGTGLFAPLSGESGTRAEGPLTAYSVETKAVVDVTDRGKPTPANSGSGVQPPSNPPPTPGGGGESGPPNQVAPPPTPAAAIDVAITGVIVGGKAIRVLVESNSLSQSQWVDVPGEAFGYQVKYATVRGAVLEKDKRTYVLVLGANKKTSPKSDYGVQGAQGPQPPGGPQPPQMMEGGPGPEQMKAMQMQRWEGRRGRGGRGGPPGGAVPMKAEVRAG
jgi:hypothetical protein